jgi:hypothetical protein
VADATREKESTGDFGNRGRRLPSIAQYLRDLIGKDCGCVDEWGARCEDGCDVGFMSHDMGLPTGLLAMECGTGRLATGMVPL